MSEQRQRWADHLRSPEWADLRWRVLARARGRCERCGHRMHRLYVHHRSYENLGHESLGELVALCQRCHAREHNLEG